ncbi:hypothetical protein BDK92_1715 [Micromonospora pisi]|uniref:Uncharacterized protein n=1 Tax=Micromonospora pisi TaxID=589240 RepID=A0A495JHB0_9ACTN|nr:hypothetical protein [Micromonospora pisi]RKR87439.1 hypothetical protein BDK92_1715 [Micromonospora pisi]
MADVWLRAGLNPDAPDQTYLVVVVDPKGDVRGGADWPVSYADAPAG